MRYEDLPPIEHDAFLAAVESPHSPLVIEAILRAALHDPDWRWVQEHALRLSHHGSQDVRSAAALALAHLARLHGYLDLDLVLPSLNRLRQEPELSGRIEDVLEDIELFTHTLSRA